MKVFFSTIFLVSSLLKLSAQLPLYASGPRAVLELGPQYMTANYSFRSAGMILSQSLGNNALARQSISSSIFPNLAERMAMPSESERFIVDTSFSHPHLYAIGNGTVAIGATTRLGRNEYRIRAGTTGKDRLQVSVGAIIGIQEHMIAHDVGLHFVQLYQDPSIFGRSALRQRYEVGSATFMRYNFVAIPLSYHRRGLVHAGGVSSKFKRNDDEWGVGITPYFLNGSAFAQIDLHNFSVVTDPANKSITLLGDVSYTYDRGFQAYSLGERFAPQFGNNYGYRVDAGLVWERRRAIRETLPGQRSAYSFRRTIFTSITIFNIGGINYLKTQGNFDISAQVSQSSLRGNIASADVLWNFLNQHDRNQAAPRVYRSWQPLPTSLLANAEVRLPFSCALFIGGSSRIYLRDMWRYNHHDVYLRFDRPGLGGGINLSYSQLTGNVHSGLSARVALQPRKAAGQVATWQPALEIAAPNILSNLLQKRAYTSAVTVGFSMNLTAMDRNGLPDSLEYTEMSKVRLKLKYANSSIQQERVSIRFEKAIASLKRAQLDSTRLMKRIITQTEKQEALKEKIHTRRQAKKPVDRLQKALETARRRETNKRKELSGILEGMKSIRSLCADIEQEYEQKKIDIASARGEYKQITGKSLPEPPTDDTYLKALVRATKSLLELTAAFW